MVIMNQNTIRTACNLCYSGCGVLVHIKDGKVTKIEGDPEHPVNKGKLCPKGQASIELLYHHDRLNYPLKQVGRKGEGKWQRISWDEALETISIKFKEIGERYGRESIFVSNGSWARGNIGISNYFAYAIGTPNLVGLDYICFGPDCLASKATFGLYAGILAPETSREMLNAECIIVWGTNPLNSFLYPAGVDILRAKHEGAKLVIVDPRKTPLAKRADLWLPIRPGTDDALALGMLNVIINEELYDKEFVNNWCAGFEKLKERVQEYPIEKVAEITWLESEKIEKAARMYAEAKPTACINAYNALETSTNAVQTIRAIQILAAVCGTIDSKGGILLPKPPGIIPEFVIGWDQSLDKLPREVKEKRIGSKEFPLYSGPDAEFAMAHPTPMMNAILTEEPYPVKAGITVNNIVMYAQDSKKVWEALKNLDFLVTIDLFMTPTAELSNIVLPAACWLERDGFWGGAPLYPYLFSVCSKAVMPLYERWDDVKIFIEIAKKMELDLPWNSVEDYNNYRLQPSGIAFEQAKKSNYMAMPLEYNKYKGGFWTPSKKVEIYSSYLEKYGYDPLPYYKTPPETTHEYPLILIGAKRILEYFHSEGRQIPMLRNKVPDPILEIHPETATALGIAEGDWVFVRTIYSKEEFILKAKLTKDIIQKAVCAPHGWWYPERPGPEHGCFESNVNVAIPDDVYDPIIGATNIRSVPCKVYKS